MSLRAIGPANSSQHSMCGGPAFTSVSTIAKAHAPHGHSMCREPSIHKCLYHSKGTIPCHYNNPDNAEIRWDSEEPCGQCCRCNQHAICHYQFAQYEVVEPSTKTGKTRKVLCFFLTFVLRQIRWVASRQWQPQQVAAILFVHEPK